jgi:hypothetical protein
MLCGTPFLREHSNDPNFSVQFVYLQPGGSALVESHYPCDGRREVRWVPDGKNLSR